MSLHSLSIAYCVVTLLVTFLGCGCDHRPSKQGGSLQPRDPEESQLQSSQKRLELNLLFGVREGEAPNQLLRDWLIDNQEELTHKPVISHHGNTLEVGNIDATDEFLDGLKSSNAQWLRVAHRLENLGHSWVGRLPTLRGVSFSAGVAITPADLEALALLPELRWLNLRDTEMSSETFAKIPTLRNLETLHLAGGLVTDANIAAMSRFPNLRTVALERSLVTDLGVTSLRNLNDRLECVDLYGCRAVSKQSLAVLSTFPELKYVALGLTQLSRDVDAAQLSDSLKPAHVDLGD